MPRPRRSAFAASLGLLLLLWPLAALAGRAPGDPKQAFRRQDMSWAQQIVLRRGELPTGVTWRAYSTGGPGGTAAGAEAACPGVRSDDSDLTLVGRASSPLFLSTNRQYAVVSVVWVFESAAQATDFVTRLDRGFSRCLPGIVNTMGGTKGVRLLSAGNVPLPGTTRAWSDVRFALSVPDAGTRIKSFVDYVLGHHGPAAGFLLLHGAYEQIPARVEAGLVDVMDGRMGRPPR